MSSTHYFTTVNMGKDIEEKTTASYNIIKAYSVILLPD